MTDLVNHPPHYGISRFGIECIEFTRLMTFNFGNAFKYIWRHEDKGRYDEDLDKALWYIADGNAYQNGVYIDAAAQGIGWNLSAKHLVPAISQMKQPTPYFALGILGMGTINHSAWRNGNLQEIIAAGRRAA